MTEVSVNGQEVKGLDFSFITQVIQFVKDHPEIVQVVKEIIALVQALTQPQPAACDGVNCVKECK